MDTIIACVHTLLIFSFSSANIAANGSRRNLWVCYTCVECFLCCTSNTQHSPFISFSQGCTIGCTQCNATGVPVGPGFPNNDTGTYSSPNIGTFGYDIGGPDLCPNDHSKSKVSWSKSCFVFKFCFWESKLQSCSQTSLT